MRKRILELLRSANGKCISGELIAKKFEVSRTAVWKHIQELRKIGYEIDSTVKSGYALRSAPDLLLPEEIQNGLKTDVIGKEIIFFDSTDSTNEQAKLLIAERKNKIADGTVIVAEEQTGGRGRLDRKFFSPARKSILFSVIIRPDISPADAPKFTLAAAVAIAKAMRHFDLPIGIKWPNDIMYKNKKLVGILTEMSAEISKIHCIIVGCGINFSIEEFPDELKDIATSIELVKKDAGIEKSFSRIEFFRKVLEEIDANYIEVKKHGFRKVFKDWKKYSITLDQDVQVIPYGEPDKAFDGRAIDIDSNGALIVKRTDGLRAHVLAGEVSIRSKDD